jgi:hypothetical protein
MKPSINLAAGFVSLALLGIGGNAGLNANVNTNASATAGSGTSASASGTAKLGVRANANASSSDAMIAKAKTRADAELDRRVKSLQALSGRLQDIARISADLKASLTTDVQTQINTLTSLKAKIDADTDATTLKTDVKSITGSYRIYALVMPKTTILAAADRIKTIADNMATVSVKLQDRISASGSADVSALNASLADMNAKIADAKVQAQAAIDLVANLSPDNGDQAKMTANHNALVSARAKIRAGMQDLQTARKDMGAILKGTKINASSTTAVSASSSTSTP